MSEDTVAKPSHSTWEAAHQHAQGMLEYAVVLALVTLAVVARATDLGTRIAGLLDGVARGISGIPVP